jgi:hypothetical protein
MDSAFFHADFVTEAKTWAGRAIDTEKRRFSLRTPLKNAPGRNERL